MKTTKTSFAMECHDEILKSLNCQLGGGSGFDFICQIASFRDDSPLCSRRQINYLTFQALTTLPAHKRTSPETFVTHALCKNEFCVLKRFDVDCHACSNSFSRIRVEIFAKMWEILRIFCICASWKHLKYILAIARSLSDVVVIKIRLWTRWWAVRLGSRLENRLTRESDIRRKFAFGRLGNEFRGLSLLNGVSFHYSATSRVMTLRTIYVLACELQSLRGRTFLCNRRFL